MQFILTVVLHGLLIPIICSSYLEDSNLRQHEYIGEHYVQDYEEENHIDNIDYDNCHHHILLEDSAH